MVRAAWVLMAAGTMWGQRAGDLMVAGRGMRDADFARTVILLADVNEQSARGFVLNQPLKARAVEALPGWHGPDVPVLAGGPVAIGINGLARGKNCHRLAAGVCLLTERAEMEKYAASGLRIVVGYTGWSRPQLADELKRGLWLLMPGDSAAIFTPDWERLVQRAEASGLRTSSPGKRE